MPPAFQLLRLNGRLHATITSTCRLQATIMLHLQVSWTGIMGTTCVHAVLDYGSSCPAVRASQAVHPCTDSSFGLQAAGGGAPHSLTCYARPAGHTPVLVNPCTDLQLIGCRTDCHIFLMTPGPPAVTRNTARSPWKEPPARKWGARLACCWFADGSDGCGLPVATKSWNCSGVGL